MFKKILIATDFSKASNAALYSGLSLAKKCLAKVVAVHSITPFEIPFDSPQPLSMLGTEWRCQVDKQFEDFFPASLYPNSTREIVVGRSAAQEILKAARTESCDLIVIGSHGHGFLERVLLGSVAQRITRNSEIPVMVVKDTGRTAQEYQGYERILVPTDFSDTSMKALDLGVHFANFLKADIHLIHVVDWPAITLLSSVSPGYPFFQVKESQPDETRMDQRLNELLVNKKLIGNSITASRVGDPSDEILLYSKKENINFIVMGTHGHKGLERVLLGSTTSSVIAKSAIPVLTISVPI